MKDELEVPEAWNRKRAKRLPSRLVSIEQPLWA